VIKFFFLFIFFYNFLNVLTFEEYCYRYYVNCDVQIYDGLILCFSLYLAELLLWDPWIFGSFYRKIGSVSLQS